MDRSSPADCVTGSRGVEGFALVPTLVVLLLVGVVLLAFSTTALLERRVAANAVARAQARALAVGAIDVARASLVGAGASRYADIVPVWGEVNGDGERDVEGDGVVFSVPPPEEGEQAGSPVAHVRVWDETGRLDLNKAPMEALRMLPGMDDQMLAGILERRLGEGFHSVLDVLTVPGVTAEMVWGRDAPGWLELCTVWGLEPNVAPDGQPRLDVATASGTTLMARLGGRWPQALVQAVVQRRQALGGFTALAQLLTVEGMTEEALISVADWLTLTQDAYVRGRVNVNTASEHVLRAIPGMTETLLEAIVASRRERRFARLEEVLRLPAARGQVAGLIDQLTVHTAAWGVEAVGVAGRGARYPIRAVLVDRDSHLQVAAWQEGTEQRYQP